MDRRTSRTVAFSLAAVLGSVVPVALATNYNVDWLQMAPTPYGQPPPFSGTYFLPNVGNVQVTYTPHSDFTEARHQTPPLIVGNVVSGSDTYVWTNNELLARTNWGNSGVLNSSWSVTYTFPNTIPAGQIILGVAGLGRRDPLPGENPQDCISVASVQQNGTHLGDWTGSQNYGPTQFTPGSGSFTMQNSLTGAGGADPHWNTGLALVRIDDPISSLTVHFDHTSGDGVGVNIALIPEPGSLALMALGAATALLRRRA